LQESSGGETSVRASVTEKEMLTWFYLTVDRTDRTMI
jgi:hypothetical protein